MHAPHTLESTTPYSSLRELPGRSLPDEFCVSVSSLLLGWHPDHIGTPLLDSLDDKLECALPLWIRVGATVVEPLE